jgi:Salt stress response/antifungal
LNHLIPLLDEEVKPRTNSSAQQFFKNVTAANFRLQHLSPHLTYDSYVNYLMDTTAQYAALNSSKKFGTAQLNLSKVDFPETYGLVQCTPDMSSSDCASCLNGLIADMPNWFSGKRGGRILGLRCNIRYEIYVFYSGVPSLNTLANVPAPTQPPPAMTPVAEDAKPIASAYICK